METIKKLMEEIQTGENDFFNMDKFVCTQEVFDSIRKLPNFKLADLIVLALLIVFAAILFVILTI